MDGCATYNRNNCSVSCCVITMATHLLDVDTPVIPLINIRRFIKDCMTSLGAGESNAEIFANNLVDADHRGHYSHGLNRLAMYVRDIQGGLCQAQGMPHIEKESLSTAWVDGKNALGAVVGNFCMNLAIQKAKETGIGWVVAHNSNHFGIAGSYALQAMHEKMLGLSFTNSSPLLVPTRAKTATLGTNPICLAAAGDKDQFVLDMATSAVAIGKIEMQQRKNEPIPSGWALDQHGLMTTDANVAYANKKLLPLGGDESTGGYKGYGLAVLVEIFCGILSGSLFGSQIRTWGDHTRPANLGQCFVAIDPSCFAPGFEHRLDDLLAMLRSTETADTSDGSVIVAGDKERLHMDAVQQAGGIKYVHSLLETCHELSKELKVLPLV